MFQFDFISQRAALCNLWGFSSDWDNVWFICLSLFLFLFVRKGSKIILKGTKLMKFWRWWLWLRHDMAKNVWVAVEMVSLVSQRLKAAADQLCNWPTRTRYIAPISFVHNCTHTHTQNLIDQNCKRAAGATRIGGRIFYGTLPCPSEEATAHKHKHCPRFFLSF